jgi:hypothetical protein
MHLLEAFPSQRNPYRTCSQYGRPGGYIREKTFSSQISPEEEASPQKSVLSRQSTEAVRSSPSARKVQSKSSKTVL